MQPALLLLVLWDLNGLQKAIPDRTVQSRYSSKLRKAEFEELKKLMLEMGAIATTPEGIKLTSLGRERLEHDLAAGKLVFWESGSRATVVSAKNAQAVLRWLASTQVRNGSQDGNDVVTIRASSSPMVKDAPIKSYEEFKVAALDAYRKLSHEHDYGSLVPIYHIRRVLADRAEHSDFDNWMLEMQGDSIFQLEKGDVSEAPADQVKDSIETAMSGLRFYAKLI